MFGVTKDIWKTYNKKEKIYTVCKYFHVLRVAKYVNRNVLKNQPASIAKEIASVNNNVDQWEYLRNKFNESKEEFYTDIPSKKKKIVFSGHILEFDKGTCAYLENMESQLENTEILLISHATNQQKAKSNQITKLKYFTLPFTFGVNRYEKHVEVEVPADVRETIEKKLYLKQNEEKIKLRHKDMGNGYPAALTYLLYEYYCEFLDYYQPEVVMLWCEFYCGHEILKDICEERNIEVLYMEFGCLPGTFAIEENGQMGESNISRNWEEFNSSYVNKEELKQADNILAYLKRTGLNRRDQVKTDILSKFKKKYMPGRPIIVMFGQNDYEAGIKPYTEKSEKYHSPIFKGSDEAALFVENLARKNRWNYIYKPHQMMVRVGECERENFHSSTTWVGDSDINELIDVADVVITIVSQCGYISLIRDKATVMLGYSQLRGKKCTYEAFEKRDVEKRIKEAIEKGFTSSQKAAFRKHTAQLLKYYLFDDGLKKNYKIGQSLCSAVSLIKKKLETKRTTAYPQRNVLFAVDTLIDMQGALDIIEEFNENTKSNILFLNHNINNVAPPEFMVTSNNIIYREIDDIMGNTEEIYTDLYVSDYEKEQLLVFERLYKINKNLNVHIYDSGRLKFYLRDYEKDYKNKGTKNFFESVKDVYVHDMDFMIWKHKLNVRALKMPKSQFLYTQYILNKADTVYANSFLMEENYISNEAELIETIKSYLNNLMVVPYGDENRDLFKNNGYRLLEDYKENGFKKTKLNQVVFSSVFNGLYYYCMAQKNVIYIDLTLLLMSNYPLFASNTYKQFLEVCREKRRKEVNYYLPESRKELIYITSLLGGNK